MREMEAQAKVDAACCRYCGGQIKDGARYCVHCGAALEEPMDRPPMLQYGAPAPKQKFSRGSKILVVAGLALLAALCVTAVVLTYYFRWKKLKQVKEEAQEQTEELTERFYTLADENLPEGGVYVTQFGKRYHLYRDCIHLAKEENVFFIEPSSDAGGNRFSCIDAAHEHGSNDVCDVCFDRLIEAKYPQQ